MVVHLGLRKRQSGDATDAAGRYLKNHTKSTPHQSPILLVLGMQLWVIARLAPRSPRLVIPPQGITTT